MIMTIITITMNQVYPLLWAQLGAMFAQFGAMLVYLEGYVRRS